MFRPTIISQQNEYLIFNGVNQYLQSQTTAQGGVNFVQWDRQQPWTFFVEIESSIPYGNDTLFATNPLLEDRGIVITTNLSTISLDLFANSSGGGVRLISIQQISNPTPKATIQITYDGSSLLSGIKYYYNNQLLTVTTFSVSTLNSSIINSANSFVVGVNLNRADNNLANPGKFFSGIIKHLSFVNYVKSVPELTVDFLTKNQSVGSGTWLLAPVELRVPANIKSLTVADINAPLPNPLALRNSQGHKMNLVGYPPVLSNINFGLINDKKVLASEITNKTTLLPSSRRPHVIGKPRYALNYNGVDQYLQSLTTAEGGLNFAQPGNSQACTYEVTVFAENNANRSDIFSSLNASNSRGAFIFLENTGLVGITLFAGSNSERLDVTTTTAIPRNVLVKLSITYDGSSSSNGLNIYFNGVLQPVTRNNIVLSLQINDGVDRFRLGARGNQAMAAFFKGLICDFAIVNYAKLPSQIPIFGVGTGAFLLAPLVPTYPNNITTLVNSNVAVVNTQGHRLVPVGYSNPLIVGVNLIQI